MDEFSAQQLFDKFSVTKPQGLIAESILGWGKSAVVIRVRRSDLSESLALKIYDSAFIDEGTQQERDQRQLKTRGHACPYLVQTLEAGKIEIDSRAYHYLLMEYVEGQDLSAFLAGYREPVAEPRIREFLSQLVEAIDELASRGLYHRDIKVENIRVRKSGTLVLLDLGVIKLVGAPELTDQGKSPFIGTLRYAPPEFLLREEKDTREGWEAVTVYQLGTVLYHFVEGQWIFSDYGEPYAGLVLAVQSQPPKYARLDKYSPELAGLLRGMLHKRPDERLKLASMQDIRNLARSKLTEKRRDLKQELDSRIKEIAKRVDASVERPKQKRIADELAGEKNAEALKALVYEVARSQFQMYENSLESKEDFHGTTAGAENGHYFFVGLLYDQGLSRGIQGTLRMHVRIHKLKTPDLVRLDGIGFWSSAKFPDRQDGNRGKVEFLNEYELIYQGQLVAETICSSVEYWINQMYARYLEDSAQYLELQLKLDGARAEGVQPKDRGLPEMVEKDYWFNTMGSCEIGQPKRRAPVDRGPSILS
ncbi:Serine/threonine-protein kinase PknB [Planctomycetaceae bacterium]|nr:Serine/threonine-protein kinase PknB [Planctomycetaceae bacterium]